jgi:hypothetical protein
VSTQIRNINDRDADFETLKNSIDMIVDDVSTIRMAMLYIYYDTRKIKRKISRKNTLKKKSDKPKREQ